MQRLAHIDISQTRNYSLIEQRRLYRGDLVLEHLCQIPAVECCAQGFRPHASERPERLPGIRPDQIKRAESPGIVEGKDMPLPGPQDQMIMRSDALGIDPPSPRHAQMEDQRIPPVHGDQPIFGPAGKPRHRSACQPLPQIERYRPAQVGATRFHRCQHLPLQHRTKASDGGFDFGKFRHEKRA